MRSKGCLSNKTALAMIFKLAESLQVLFETWPRFLPCVLSFDENLIRAILRFKETLQSADRPQINRSQNKSNE
jgi:hypothetical protein